MSIIFAAFIAFAALLAPTPAQAYLLPLIGAGTAIGTVVIGFLAMLFSAIYLMGYKIRRRVKRWRATSGGDGAEHMEIPSQQEAATSPLSPASPKPALAEMIAKGTRQFLVIFVLFSLGFVASIWEITHMQNTTTVAELGAELLPYARKDFDQDIAVSGDAGKAFQGGAILAGPEFSSGAAMSLIDDKGKILHRWQVENQFFNSATQQWWGVTAIDKGFAIDDAALLPGGDVVFMQDSMDVGNFRGQRLARMDRSSKILWQVTGNFHNSLSIGGNPQRIYALSSSISDELPDIAPNIRNINYLEDWIEVYTLDGKKEAAWSIPAAFARSPYRSWLSAFDIDMPAVQRITTGDRRVLYDFYSPTSVEYLDAAQARALPGAQEGDLLISMKTMNAVAVFHPATSQIVWASKGPWHHQQNARAEKDGKLYMVDNEGRQSINGPYDERKQPRLTSFSPASNQMREIFAPTDLFNSSFGDYTRLPDGNWLIDSPLHGRIFLVSPEKKILWQMRTIPDFERNSVPYRKEISFMHYYPASALEFLHSSGGAQP